MGFNIFLGRKEKNKMKILMLSPYFYPHTGGTEKYVKDLSIQLVKLGHEVTVISNNVPIAKKAPKEEIIQGVKIIRMPAIDTFYLPISMPFDLKLTKGYDIIHCHAPAFSYVRSVAGKLKIPVIVTYHCDTVIFDKIMGIPVPNFIKKAFEGIMNSYARMWLPKVDGILATSESYASGSPVLKDFPHYVAPIGVHYENFDKIIEKLKLSEKTKVKNQILFVGRLAANKGVEYLIRAVPLVIEKFPDAQFILAGEGEEKPHLQTLIKAFKVEKNIKFYGVLTFEKLVELYTNSLIFVLPSINPLEAFGIVQLEAMACRTACVISNIRGVNSVMEVGKSGYLVEKQNPNDLAEKICLLLENPAKAIEMGKRGRKLCEEKYNWEKIARRIVEIYNELIKKKGGER